MPRSPEGDEIPTGTCLGMCPSSEIAFRTAKHLIHPLESVDPSLPTKSLRPDPTKMVKEYTRSAAGCNLLNAKLLRPVAVLDETVTYLLELFDKLKDGEKIGQVYTFIVDRLRAVRQDMVIQRLSTGDTLRLLEKMIPFYLETEYLCRTKESSAFYDWKLHATQLEDCFSTWTACIPKETYNLDILAALVLRNRHLLRSLYSFLPSTKKKLVLDLVLSAELGNFVRFFRIFSTLDSRIVQFAAVQLVQEVRTHAFTTLSIGFKSRGAVIPLQVIVSWLGFDSLDDATIVAAHFAEVDSANLLIPSIDLSRPVPAPIERVLCRFDCAFS